MNISDSAQVCLPRLLFPFSSYDFVHFLLTALNFCGSFRPFKKYYAGNFFSIDWVARRIWRWKSWRSILGDAYYRLSRWTNTRWSGPNRWNWMVMQYCCRWCLHIYLILRKWSYFLSCFLLSLSSIQINPVELTLTMVSFSSFRWSKALKILFINLIHLKCCIGLLTLINQDDDITALQVQSFSHFITFWFCRYNQTSLCYSCCMSIMWLFWFRCKFAFFMLRFFHCKMFSESIFKYLFHCKIWLTVKYFLLSKKHSTKTCKTFHTKLLIYYDSKSMFLICKPKVVPSKLLWEFFCHSWFIFPTSCFSICHIN